tara:strand:+ start:347 stop:553 length:207 start_codon:yes stop_codon:yes gene_type:complete
MADALEGVKEEHEQEGARRPTTAYHVEALRDFRLPLQTIRLSAAGRRKRGWGAALPVAVTLCRRGARS